ncbi:zinc finger and BTB domain-containing protein 8A-like isoform X2 [Terrapene carolina triunguis]|uniref:zinc finger and BTB domain-containing protein 8A-like isoform X2 n=1 Tax=Terrapene triunguis TaxID=2587831 RepID=UPI000E779244|nr:zinc finger and BTB domain-containing protein 8A-like isoform X2 [Terrapene carolina triunguis]
MDISSHQSRLLQQLNEQRRQDLFCDCSILVEGKVFKAHRNVLFASSGYFKMLLSQSSKDMSQPTTATFHMFSPDTFMVILDFVYSGKLSLTGQNVIEVMSAASYLQMTDIISVCKTFIKSSLDISEKEKDRYFSLSEKDLNSNGTESPCLYSPEWRVESSPPHSQMDSDVGVSMVGGNSWSNCTYYSASQRNTQQSHLTKPTQRRHSFKKRIRHLGLPQSTDVPHCKSRKLGDRASEPTSHISQSEEQTQLDTEVDFAHAGYQRGLRSEVLPRSLPDDVRFKCPFCTHMVKRKADLKRHLRCHTGERPYPCEACGKRFTRLEHLRSHFRTIHQACKPICRKCKRHVTDMTGQVVQEGTRRYRLCNECLVEAGIESIPIDLEAEQSLGFSPEEEDKDSRWHFGEEHRTKEVVEDDSAGLVIQEVDDSEDEAEKKEVKPNIS